MLAIQCTQFIIKSFKTHNPAAPSTPSIAIQCTQFYNYIIMSFKAHNLAAPLIANSVLTFILYIHVCLCHSKYTFSLILFPILFSYTLSTVMLTKFIYTHTQHTHTHTHKQCRYSVCIHIHTHVHLYIVYLYMNMYNNPYVYVHVLYL